MGEEEVTASELMPVAIQLGMEQTKESPLQMNKYEKRNCKFSIPYLVFEFDCLYGNGLIVFPCYHMQANNFELYAHCL